MIILERLRLLVAGFLCTAYLLVYGYSLWIDRDGGWPVSIYPMFSEGRSQGPFKAYRVFGVTDAKGEERIYNKDLYPLDSLRLLDGFTRMTPADRAEALRFVLARNPRFRAVRLYDETWQAGGEKLQDRKMLVEVAQ